MLDSACLVLEQLHAMTETAWPSRRVLRRDGCRDPIMEKHPGQGTKGARGGGAGRIQSNEGRLGPSWVSSKLQSFIARFPVLTCIHSVPCTPCRRMHSRGPAVFRSMVHPCLSFSVLLGETRRLPGLCSPLRLEFR